MLGQNQRAQGRCHRERGDKSADKRVSIGLRHRPEDMSFDTAQREQWNEARDDDPGSKEYRAVHICRRRERLREVFAMQPQPGGTVRMASSDAS